MRPADLIRLMRKQELVGYFGYGSLVNRDTIGTRIVAAYPARLKGWQRAWLPRPDIGSYVPKDPGAALRAGQVPAVLSAVCASGAQDDAAIDGLLVIDQAENLPKVDAREALYHRRDIMPDALEFQNRELAGLAHDLQSGGVRLYVYEARGELEQVQGERVILRSYLDAVLQGFAREFGSQGVHRFVAETGAFHTPILEDRHAPIYPRAVPLSPAEKALFDAALKLVATRAEN